MIHLPYDYCRCHFKGCERKGTCARWVYRTDGRQWAQHTDEPCVGYIECQQQLNNKERV